MTIMAERPSPTPRSSQTTTDCASRLQARAYFEPSINGALAARTGVASQLVRWGYAPLATRAGSIVGILANWLVDHGPSAGNIEVLVHIEGDALEVCARDHGDVLPALDSYDELLRALSQLAMRSFGATPGPAGGRILGSSISLSYPWRAVYAWRVAAGQLHAERTVDGWPSSDAAKRAIMRTLDANPVDGVALAAAHIEGPDGERASLYGQVVQ